MAKYRFYASLGFAGANREETYEIDEEELRGLSEDELSKVVQEHYNDWLGNYSDFTWWPEVSK